MASGARWGLIPCWIEQPMLLRWGKMASGARWGLILPEPVHFRHSSLGKMASGARWGLILGGTSTGKVIRGRQNGQWSPLGIDTGETPRPCAVISHKAKWPVEPVGD